MGCIDARKGIFWVHDSEACSHLLTNVNESKFTDEIIEGWGLWHPYNPS